MLTRVPSSSLASPVLLLYFVLQELPLWFLPLRFRRRSCRQRAMRHSGTSQSRVMSSALIPCFILFSPCLLKWNHLNGSENSKQMAMFRNGKAAKATFSCYSCKAFFCEAAQDYCCSSASPILIFASLRRYSSELQRRFVRCSG